MWVCGALYSNLPKVLDFLVFWLQRCRIFGPNLRFCGNSIKNFLPMLIDAVQEACTCEHFCGARWERTKIINVYRPIQGPNRLCRFWILNKGWGCIY